jgi:hypothetical protein
MAGKPLAREHTLQKKEVGLTPGYMLLSISAAG